MWLFFFFFCFALWQTLSKGNLQRPLCCCCCCCFCCGIERKSLLNAAEKKWRKYYTQRHTCMRVLMAIARACVCVCVCVWLVLFTPPSLSTPLALYGGVDGDGDDVGDGGRLQRVLTHTLNYLFLHFAVTHSRLYACVHAHTYTHVSFCACVCVLFNTLGRQRVVLRPRLQLRPTPSRKEQRPLFIFAQLGPRCLPLPLTLPLSLFAALSLSATGFSFQNL